MKALILAAAALAAASSASAADRPRNAMNELKTISDMTRIDAVQAVTDERRRNLVRQVYTPADHAPWDGGVAVCAQPRNQYLMAFGEFMTRHTRRDPNDRFGPPMLSTMRVMNDRLRLDITDMTKHLPPEGWARFLDAGETLADDPKSWDQAARQRAEWTVALDGVLSGLSAKAHMNVDFGANYAAGLWTRMACDFQAQDAAFLRHFAANGGAPADERTRAALELLRARAH